jgi:predicted HTH transcriptional regulator
MLSRTRYSNGFVSSKYASIMTNWWSSAFPGPDRSIRLEDLQASRAVSRRYRNRRISEFLKELDLTEGRSTGIPKILKVMANGSPSPSFETNDDGTSFVIRLPRRPPTPASNAMVGEVTTERSPVAADGKHTATPRIANRDRLEK